MAILTRQHNRADSQVRRFFRRLSHPNCSDRSTFSVESVEKDSSTTITTATADEQHLAQETPVRQVRFNVQVRVYQANPVVQEPSALWYSQQEIETFQTQAKTSASVISQAESLAASCALTGQRSAAHLHLLRRLHDLNDMTNLDQRARLMAQASSCASQASCLRATQLGRWWASHV